jgi:hypothetical protein
MAHSILLIIDLDILREARYLGISQAIQTRTTIPFTRPAATPARRRCSSMVGILLVYLHYANYHNLLIGTGISLTSMLSAQGSLFIVILDGTTAGPFTLNSLTSQPAVVYTVENLQYAQHNATFMKSSSNPSDQTLFNIDSITWVLLFKC